MPPKASRPHELKIHRERSADVLVRESNCQQRMSEKTESKARKARSNRRLKTLCSALQRKRDPAKVRELKGKLGQEFFRGDEPE
jgi:hypothetical protein